MPCLATQVLCPSWAAGQSRRQDWRTLLWRLAALSKHALILVAARLTEE